ncbi:hypothetical protein J6590_055799 [Homalodisca vitripennis]|nr:hypothetical protein J6590_055799 [Homalodisca vitripennis]
MDDLSPYVSIAQSVKSRLSIPELQGSLLTSYGGYAYTVITMQEPATAVCRSVVRVPRSCLLHALLRHRAAHLPPSTQLQLASENSPTFELLIDNARLKAKVITRKAEVKVILDHSIESDQRLLQFPGAIFKSSTSVTPHKKPCTNYVNASAQTEELPYVLENTLVKSMKIADIEKEIKDLKRPCRELSEKK